MITPFFDGYIRAGIEDFFCCCSKNAATRKSYALSVEAFAQWCEARGAGNVANVTGAAVEDWTADLQQRYSVATVKLRLAALKKFFVLMQQQGVRSDNPVDNIKGPRQTTKSKTDALDEGQIESLLAGITSEDLSSCRDRAIIATLFETGAPVRAILNIRLQDLKLSGQRVELVFRPNQHTTLTVMASSQLRQFLLCYLNAGMLELTDTGYLFRTIARGTSKLSPYRIPPSNLHAMIKRRIKKAGLPASISAHTFRTTAIVSRLGAKSPRAIAEELGLEVRSVKKYIKRWGSSR